MFCDLFVAANRKWDDLYYARGTEKWLEFLAGQSNCLVALAEFLVDQIFLKKIDHKKISSVKARTVLFKSISHFRKSLVHGLTAYFIGTAMSQTQLQLLKPENDSNKFHNQLPALYTHNGPLIR
jgi:hypothetical protein